MSAGPIYQHPSLARWNDAPERVHDQRDQGFPPRGGPPPNFARPRYPTQPDSFQVWNPPQNAPYDPYGDSPQVQTSYVLPVLSSVPGSPPPLVRRSLINDPAFAVDPYSNPNNWNQNFGTAAVAHSNASTSDFRHHPHGFPSSEASSRSTPVPVPASTYAPSRPQSYAQGTSAPPTPSHGPVYFVPPSMASSSSSISDHSSHSSEHRSSDRSSRRANGRQEPPAIYIAPTNVSSSHPDITSRDREEYHSRQSSEIYRPPPSYNESVDSHTNTSGTASSASVHSRRVIDEKPPPIVLSYHPPEHDPAELDPALPLPSPPQPQSGPSERSQERPRRKSTTKTAVPLQDLDSIDELDETTPYGVGIHHNGPYEAIAAILGQRRPLELSPDGAPIELEPVAADYAAPRQPRRHKHRSSHSHPTNANPMSLNLQPGQILKGSIYQPPPFPLARAPATYPPDHYMATPHPDTYHARADPSATDSPLRRNQTLPAPESGAQKYPPNRDRSYRMPEPPPQMQQRPSHRQFGASDPRAYQPLTQPVLLPPDGQARRDQPREMPQPVRRDSQFYSNGDRQDGRTGQAIQPSPHPPQDQREPSQARQDGFHDGGYAPDARRDMPAPSRRASMAHINDPGPGRQSAVYQHGPPPPPGVGESFAPAGSRPNTFYGAYPTDRMQPPPSRPDSFFAGPPVASPRPPPPPLQQAPPPQLAPQPSRQSPPSSHPPQQSTRQPPPSTRQPSQPRPQPQPQQQQSSSRSPPPPQSQQQQQPPTQRRNTSTQDGSQQSRRYEPLSQTLAMQFRPPPPDIPMPPPSILSSSTQSGSLPPSHVPRRLVMPTPLASSPENAQFPPSDPNNRAHFAENPRNGVPTQRQGPQHQRKASTIPMSQEGARNLLRKRSVPVPPPPPEPERVHNGGILAFFGFGGGAKAKAQVKIVEPRVVNGVRERQRQVTEVRDEKNTKRLSKRK